MKHLGWIIVTASLVGCGGAQQRADNLMEAVRGYNEDVRWERYPSAAARVPSRERDLFIDEREEVEKDLHISDYELVKVTGAKSAQDKATIEVKYTWFKESEGVVRETRALQTWERHGKSWLIIDEHRTKGPEMPGLPEPDAEPAPAPETDSEEDADPGVSAVNP